MALSSSAQLGNASVSSLIKSAQSIQTEIASFQDDEAKINYENSAKTSADLQTYTAYLGTRITSLQTTGSVSDATKALNMQQDVVSATHENISADITRENINLMSQGQGGSAAGYQDKMGVVSNEYTRALSIGDDALAQSLMSQYYSLSQSYQTAVQAAADAASTLSSAGTTSKVSYEGDVVTNLTTFLKSFTGTAKNLSEKELNSTTANYAKQASATLKTLGVNLPSGAQPNYWDLVSGVTGAIYNAQVLKAQAESVKNPLVAQTYAEQAQNYLTGATKVSTLAGDLTVQEIQQAQQDPHMFAYDSSTGTYKKTVQSGYQYMTMTNADGSSAKELVPQYSGYVSSKQANQVTFLSPTQTVQMTKLGLDFTENVSGKSVGNTSSGISGSTGNGVEVQLTKNTPQWLQSILGTGGVSNIYLGQDGFLEFKGASSSGQGDSLYTVATDGKGLHGLYEQLPDGSYHLSGGDYGFNASAVNLLLGQAQQTQHLVAVQTAQAQAKLQAQMLQTQQNLKMATPAPVQPVAPKTQAQKLQPTLSPQLPTFNPQGNNVNPQGGTVNPQGNNVGAGLNQSGTGGIKLGSSSGTSIKL